MIIEDVSKEDLSSFSIETYEDEFFKIIGYKENNEMMGYITFHHIYERIEILYIFVKENQRGRKIGKSMLEYLLAYAKKQQCENITLEVNEQNEIAIHLYESLGFQKVAKRKGYYNGIDGILMEWIV